MELKDILKRFDNNCRIIKSDSEYMEIRTKLEDSNFNERCNYWLKQFSSSTCTQWIVYKNYPNIKNMEFRKDFVCQHNAKNKNRTKDSLRDRNKACNAKIIFKIKKINRFTRYKDAYIKEDNLNVIILIYFNHSHHTDMAEAYGYLRISAETKNQFIQYFENGLSPREAKNVHKSSLLASTPKNEICKTLANAQINPTDRTVYHIFGKWSAARAKALYKEIKPKVEIEHVDVCPPIPTEEIDVAVPGTSSMEFLPESQELTRPKKVAKRCTNAANMKTYCRLCLQVAPKNQLVCLGDFHDWNYPSRSKQFKRNKILQTEMYIRMINKLIPDFDHDLVFNPVMCTRCSTRLQLASDFIEECMTTQKVIQKYRETYCPSDELVSCEDVVQNRSKIYISETTTKRKPPIALKVYGNAKVAKMLDTAVQEPVAVDPVSIEESMSIVKAEDLEPYDDITESFEVTSADLSSIKEELQVQDVAYAAEQGSTKLTESRVKIEPVTKTEPVLTESVDANISSDLDTDSVIKTASNNFSSEANTNSVVELLPPVQFCPTTVPLQFVQQVSHNYTNLVNPLTTASVASTNVYVPTLPNDGCITNFVNFKCFQIDETNKK